MSAKLINNNMMQEQKKLRERILVMGPASRGIAGALLRMESNAEILAVEKAGEATRIPGAGWGLWALGKALEAILKVIGMGVQALIGAPMTVLDMLAWALERAISIGSKISDWVLSWLRSALRWMGRAVEVGETVTSVFLRYILGLFLRAMAGVARAALDSVSRIGRA